MPPPKLEQTDKPVSTLAAWTPYLLVALLLVVTRIIKPLKAKVLEMFAFTVPTGFDAKVANTGFFDTSLGEAVQPLYVPGSIFVLVSFIAFVSFALLDGFTLGGYGRAWKDSCRTMYRASIAMLSAVAMVQVFINSKGGSSGYADMPRALAEGVVGLLGSAWPALAPFVGGIGAAVAGSNTLSNMMFSQFQFQVGLDIGADPVWIVALQAIGGAAGNTICVHNVVAASAVVGLTGQEGAVIRKTCYVFLYYALVPGLFFWAFAQWLLY